MNSTHPQFQARKKQGDIKKKPKVKGGKPKISPSIPFRSEGKRGTNQSEKSQLRTASGEDRTYPEPFYPKVQEGNE